MQKKNVQDIKTIMGIEEEMICILPAIKQNVMNPWIRRLSGIFQKLNLQKGQVVLDLPCGRGGVSIPLAKKYGVKILGYDVLEEYINAAKSLAKSDGVAKLCKFTVEDIREVVKRKNFCDVLLWIAAPQLWNSSKNTIRSLRNCVRNKGIIFIGDAYVYKPDVRYKGYETLEKMNEGYRNYGDKIVDFIDYRNTLWKEDYQETRKPVQEALKRATDGKDKVIMRRYLNSLDKSEKTDIECLGLGIWIIKVMK